MIPLSSGRKPKRPKDLPPGKTPVALPVALESKKAGSANPELAIVIVAWPSLPAALKVGIIAMVRARHTLTTSQTILYDHVASPKTCLNETGLLHNRN